MFKKLKKKDKRALLAGTVLVGAILVVTLAVMPLLDANEQMASSLEQTKRRWVKSRQTIANQDAYRNRLRDIEEALNGLESRLLGAPNSNVAETRLLQILNELAEDSEVTISRTNPVPEQVEGSYTKVTLQVNLDCGITELTDFLRAIVTHPKYLSIDEFTLNTGRTRRRQRKLRPRIRISGFIRPS